MIFFPELSLSGRARGIVGKANTAIVQKEREGRPTLENVIDRLDEIVPARKPNDLFTQIGMEILDNAGSAFVEFHALRGALAVDGPLDLEQRVMRCTTSIAMGDSAISFLPAALRRAFSSMSAMAKNGRRALHPTRRLPNRRRLPVRM